MKALFWWTHRLATEQPFLTVRVAMATAFIFRALV